VLQKQLSRRNRIQPPAGRLFTFKSEDFPDELDLPKDIPYGPKTGSDAPNGAGFLDFALMDIDPARSAHSAPLDHGPLVRQDVPGICRKQ